ncbi:MAG: hypothetical protein ACI8PT_002297 [Gammaproteobacteria bacterium]|jgi:hypothetical protein
MIGSNTVTPVHFAFAAALSEADQATHRVSKQMQLNRAIPEIFHRPLRHR